MIRGDLVPLAAVAQVERPVLVCCCNPKYFPGMLDADCPLHGLQAIIEGRFDIDEHLNS